jgi:thiamine biosynthesis lipoprotein ApbE
MPFPRPSILFPLVLLCWNAGFGWARAGEDFAFFHENVMGTSLELHVRADGPEAARWAEERVLGEIDRLALCYSSYDSASEFFRWQAAPTGPARVSLALYEMLSACDFWRDRSRGAFDPRVEVFSRLWSQAAGSDRRPTAIELSQALSILAQPAWRLDPRSHTAYRLSACPLSLNAIAKGEIVERACASALAPARGVRGLLLNIGGDLRVCGEMTATLGIASPWGDSESSPPITLVEAKDRAVSTSGSAQRGFRIQGRWYSHIIDPRTGMPAEKVLAATVIAPRSAAADALATICNVLDPVESLVLVRSIDGAECLIIDSQGRITRSEGWRSYELSSVRKITLVRSVPPPAGAEPRSKTPLEPPAAGTPWNQGFELEVDFEINLPEGERRSYRRPYLAIWVENKEGFPVRNLMLWVSMGGAGPFQWLPDLKRWYRADLARKQVDSKDMVFTIARPTRPPGKYKVIWDGKDDHGKPVAGGEYTILIDAAREHGTYQHIRRQVTLRDKPFTENLKGNVEIKSATIDYRKKAPAKPAQ